MSYALISNPFRSGEQVQGSVLSSHHTCQAAERARDKKQRRCRDANPGSSLDLAVIHVRWTNGEQARGVYAATVI